MRERWQWAKGVDLATVARKALLRVWHLAQPEQNEGKNLN